jgi:hypothetical protein
MSDEFEDFDDIGDFSEPDDLPLLPQDHPLRRDAPINRALHEQPYQWRLVIQPFSEGGFEAKAVLVDRDKLSMLIAMNRNRGKRTKPRERDEYKIAEDRNKSALRAAKKVRQLCLEIGADRLLTLTSRGLLADLDNAKVVWARFMRLLDRVGAKFRYITVPEYHANGEHIHLHVALSGYVRVDTLRRCWQIALGGKGNERGPESLGNVDIKYRFRKGQSKGKRCAGIAGYLSKYIVKDFEQHYQFNKKRYWAPRGIKLPEKQGEWLPSSENVGDVMRALYDRFGTEIMQSVFSDSLFYSEVRYPMIFFRWMPDQKKLPVPF